MKWLVISLSLFLASCASFTDLPPEVKQEVQIATACSSYGTFMNVLRPVATRISPLDLEALKILTIRVKVACLNAAAGEYTESPDKILRMISEGLEIITLLACHYSPNSEACI